MDPRLCERKGLRVPQSSRLPKMRARMKSRASDSDLVVLLDEALSELSGTPCAFWACQGPGNPQHMCTCKKCWAMRRIGTVRETLAARESA